MKISKLFHWLYALLMLLPFILLGASALSSIFSGASISGNLNNIWFNDFSDMIDSSFNIFGNGLSSTVNGVYVYLIEDIFGIEASLGIGENIVVLLTYWTVVSIIWLVFDVFMYIFLLCHRWLDKGVIE